MNVLLVSANIQQKENPVQPLGLAQVAAATQEAGHNVVLVDLKSEADPGAVLGEAVTESRPDLIGISVRNIDDQTMSAPMFLLDQAKEVVALCRNLSSAPIVLGGAGYSIFPQSALDYLQADMGIQGEGEAALPTLIEALENGGDLAKVPGLYLPGAPVQQERVFAHDLDAFPLPDTSLLRPSLQKDEEPWIPVQTRRGCPMKCSYCSTPAIEGTVMRQHSPGVIVDWIARWVAEGFGRFFFVDNVFNLPLSYAKDLCRGFIERNLNIQWQAIVYPKGVRSAASPSCCSATAVDEELVRLMAKAGCSQVGLGFESGSELILRNLNKGFTFDEVRRVSELFAEHGIKRMGFLLLGGPGETKATVAESFDAADSLNLDMLKVTTGIRIYPNTPLAAQAVEEGVISPGCDLLDPCFYMAEGLGGRCKASARRSFASHDWLVETVSEWRASRSYPVF